MSDADSVGEEADAEDADAEDAGDAEDEDTAGKDVSDEAGLVVCEGACAEDGICGVAPAKRMLESIAAFAGASALADCAVAESVCPAVVVGFAEFCVAPCAPAPPCSASAEGSSINCARTAANIPPAA